MGAKSKINVEAAIRDSINQAINYEDLTVPKICEIPSINEFLRIHPNISPVILSAYNRNGLMPDSSTDIMEAILVDPDKYYSPFEVSVFGAYPFMGDWKNLMETMKIAYDKKSHSKYIGMSIRKGNKYKTINFDQYLKERVLKRLEDFAKGFKDGFDSFIVTHIESNSAITTGIEFKVKRVIDFLATNSKVKSGFQTIRYRTTEPEGFDLWFKDGITTGHEYHAWYYVFINHKFFETHFDSLLKAVPEYKSTEVTVVKPVSTPIMIIDPLSFIDQYLLNLFHEVEGRALGSSGKFISKIRCAAFCEMLYEKKLIKQTKTRIKTMVSFAKSKYGMDIKVSLSSSKKDDRNNHKNKTVNKVPSLKYCFK